MVHHSPMHRLHAALDDTVGLVASIDQAALDKAAAHRADQPADDQDTVTDMVTVEGGA